MKKIVLATVFIVSIFVSNIFAENKNTISDEYIKIGIKPEKINGATFGDYFDGMVNGSAISIGSLEVFVDSNTLTYKEIFEVVAKQVEEIDNKYERFYTIESVSYSVPNEAVKGTKDFFIHINLKAKGNYKFKLVSYTDNKLKTLYKSEYAIPVNITVIKNK